MLCSARLVKIPKLLCHQVVEIPTISQVAGQPVNFTGPIDYSSDVRPMRAALIRPIIPMGSSPL